MIKTGMMFVCTGRLHIIDIIISVNETKTLVLRMETVNKLDSVGECSLFEFYDLDSKTLAKNIAKGNYWNSNFWACVNV